MCFSGSTTVRNPNARRAGETEAEYQRRLINERGDTPSGSRSVADIMAEKASSGYSNNASAPGRGGSKM